LVIIHFYVYISQKLNVVDTILYRRCWLTFGLDFLGHAKEANEATVSARKC